MPPWDPLLVQLAVRGHVVLLRVHAAHAGGVPLPPSLHALLATRGVLKMGVGIGQDIKLLRSQHGVPASGVSDAKQLCLLSK